MKPALTLFTALLLAPLAALHAADAPKPSSPEPTTSVASQQAAFGVESIKLGGVMGHHIDTMIKGNLLQLDMEGTYLSYFRRKQETGGVRSLGKTLDAAVHLAAYSGDSRLVSWKNHWIDELISTQEPDGYIGICRAGHRGTPTPTSLSYDNHEKGQIILALVNDYRFFGRTSSLQAAKKLAGEIMTHWTVLPANNTTATFAYPIVMLSEASGDESYAAWIREHYLPDGKLTGLWPKQLGGNPLAPLNMEGLHVYSWCDASISMRMLDRHYPDPALKAAGVQMIDWLKDGGALAPGSFSLEERWRRSQTTRSGMSPDPQFCFANEHSRTKVGESCATFYTVELLDHLTKTKPDPYIGDVMERTIYNEMFAAQTPDGRSLAYDLSVEGTRVRNPRDHYCCPGNLRRAFAYLPKYFYSQSDNSIFVNLYGESNAQLKTSDGATIRLVQSTGYPASGRIRVTVEVSKPFEKEIAFRVPAWCSNPELRVNGTVVSAVRLGTHFPVRREWKTGDVVELDFPMAWRWLLGIREQEGRAVLARGPVIYSLDPVTSGITEYEDMRLDPNWGIQGTVKFANRIPNVGQHMAGFRVLESITLNPATVSEVKADDRSKPFGLEATVKGWIGSPQGDPNRTFVFREFANPMGRKIYLRLSDPSACSDDELFGMETHEKTLYPARWAAVTNSLNTTKLSQIPDEGLKDALLVTPMRGSHEFETAAARLGGRPAWMSCSLAGTAKRRMEFRVQDKKFQNGTTPQVTLTVLYLDKGDCKVSLIYDSGDDVVRVRGRAPGAFKPGGEFEIGNTGTIKRHDFKLPDARFAKNLLLEGTDFRLAANKDADFVILGAFLQPLKTK